MKVHELISHLQSADPEMEVEAAALIEVPHGGTLNVDEGTLTPPDNPRVRIPNMMRTFEITTVSEGGKVDGPRLVILGFEVPMPDPLDDDFIN